MKQSAVMVVACSALVVGSAAVGSYGAEPTLRYRGAGSSRTALDQMQLKPFDQGLWSNLSNWQGKAPTTGDMDGKVVMIVTWSGWYPRSHGAMRTAESLYQQHKAAGLMVIGVHNPVQSDKAAESAKALGVTFPTAEDKDGKFRQALKADQDPNVYFIDRAGNLRYAQVDTASATDAAAHLVAETTAEAKDFPTKLAREKAAAEAARWKTGDPSRIVPGQEPEVEFEDPSEDDYSIVKWPYFVGKVEQDKILETWSNTPPKLELVEDQWIPDAPKARGKLLVVYLFDPKEIAMLNVIPVMNRLADRNKRDVVVVGNAVKLGENGLNIQGEEAEKMTRRNTDLLRTMLNTRSPNHALQPQPIKMDQFEFQMRNGQTFTGIPVFLNNGLREEFGTALLVSTDNKVRWIGSPWNPDLQIAIDKVAALDPAVKARRKAEDVKLKSSK